MSKLVFLLVVGIAVSWAFAFWSYSKYKDQTYITHMVVSQRQNSGHDFRTDSLSSGVFCQRGETLPVYLHSANETRSVLGVKDYSCPYSHAGEVLRHGDYQLTTDAAAYLDIFERSEDRPASNVSFDIGRQTFGQREWANGSLRPLELDDHSCYTALVLYESGPCNFQFVEMFGYDFESHQIKRYLFKDKDGKTSTTLNSMGVIDSKTADIDQIIKTRYYDNGVGRTRSSTWKLSSDWEFTEIARILE